MMCRPDHSKKLDDRKALEIGQRRRLGVSRLALAREFGVSKTTIDAVVRGHTFSHIASQLPPIAIRTKKNRGSLNTRAKLTEAIVQDMRARRRNGELVTRLAKEYGVSAWVAGCAIRGATWRHVPDPVPVTARRHDPAASATDEKGAA
jgi:hypothetical protein